MLQQLFGHSRNSKVDAVNDVKHTYNSRKSVFFGEQRGVLMINPSKVVDAWKKETSIGRMLQFLDIKEDEGEKT